MAGGRFLVWQAGRFLVWQVSRFPVWQVSRFLASEEGEEFESAPPQQFHVPLDGAYLRLTPARHGCDGFFCALLRRRVGGWSRATRRGGPKRKS